jgi:mono/diheme cytochrome c family protein
VKRVIKITTLVLFLFIVGTIIIGYFYVRNGGFSAREEPSWVETFMARNARKIAAPAGAKGLQNPETMTDAKWGEAREHFVEHCSACHGADGRGDTIFGKNMYPKVPDLADAQTQGLSDGEIFYIISNGIRLTGMPAFGGEDSPESIWHLVSFIRRLPSLTPEEVKQLKGLAGEESGDGGIMGGANEKVKGRQDLQTPGGVSGQPGRRVPKPHEDRPGAKPHTHKH